MVPIAVAVAVDSFVVILVSMSTECLEYSRIHFNEREDQNGTSYSQCILTLIVRGSQLHI